MQDARTRWALAAIGLVIFGGKRRRAVCDSAACSAAGRDHDAAAADRPPAPNSGGVSGRDMPPRPLPHLRRRPPSIKPAPVIYVHVAGAVKHPSLYTLAPGSRVMQAIKAAGGPAPKADLDAINLAEKVRDGEKVYVPRPAAAGRDGGPAGQHHRPRQRHSRR